MFNDKTTGSRPGKSPVLPEVSGNGAVAGAKPPAPELVNLEIDESDNGGDPYNRTGSHCVLKIFEDA